MITQQAPAGQADWQREQAEAITSARELFELLGLDLAALPAALAADADFPLRVPRAYVARIRPGDPHDPLLRQVLASGEELVEVAGFSRDPLAEASATPVPGILHKYRGRVLLLVTGACAVHCRYCFRRHFPYQEHLPTLARLDAALDWLAERTDISEVILSGGDPLSVSDRRLAELLARLAEIGHLRRLRVHSRLPVVIPSRINSALVSLLSDNRWQASLVLHANHADELTPALAEGVARLRGAGVTVMNQAVLLAGINDSLAAQVALSESLFAAGVLPYYLHLLDPVAGAAHFQVPEDQARSLHGQMREHLPGYLVPTLVAERAGEGAKAPL